MSRGIVEGRPVVPLRRLRPAPPNPYVLPAGALGVAGDRQKIVDTPRLGNAVEPAHTSPATVLAPATRIL